MDDRATTSRRAVLAGLAGFGAATTGFFPRVTGAAGDDVLLGDFETGLDGWQSAGSSLLGTIPESAYPGAVTRGSRALEVTVTGDLLPAVWNEERVDGADFSGHPYLIADVTPGPVAGLDSDLTFKLRYYRDDATVEIGDAFDLGGLTGVYESPEQTRPPHVRSRLTWDLSDLPDAALSNPGRLEIVWYPTELSPEADLDVEYEGRVVFDDVRLTDRLEALSAARLENVWRDLQLTHGHLVETVVDSRGETTETGDFVFADGASVPYAFEVLGEGRFRYDLDGRSFLLVGPARPTVPDRGTGTPSTTATTRSTTATVLTYIPGTSENTGEGGDEYDSAMPDVSDHIDNAFHADDRTSLESNLSAATAVDKDLAEYPERLFPHYRVRNGIAVSFDSTAEGGIGGPVSVESAENSSLSPITLEGEPGEGDDNPYRENLDSIHGGEEWKPALPREHFVGHDTVRVDGVEGVRASTIYGGVDRYIAEYLDALADGGELELGSKLADTPAPYVLDHVLALPAFYSFVELTAMADGTRVARVWDAGRYPQHALYLEGEKRGESNFDRGEEWWRNEPMNARFSQWGSESTLGLHPYKSPHLAYEWRFRAGGGPHPLLVAGEDGEVLTADRVVEATPRPHVPF